MSSEELDRRAGGRFPLSPPRSRRGAARRRKPDRTEARFARRRRVRVREWHPRGPHPCAALRPGQARCGGAVRRRAQRPRLRGARRRSRCSTPTYSVRFASRELWGEGGTDGDVIHVDLWERYLEESRERRTEAHATHGAMGTNIIPSRSRRSKRASLRSSRCSSSRACSTPRCSTRSSRTSSTTSVRSTAPRSSPAGVGRSRLQGPSPRPTAPRRSPSSASAAPRAITWSSSRTRRQCTTSSSARCARATRGRRSACRPRGTRRPPTAHVRCASHAALLAEMGTPIPDDVEIRVWDSSAEVRYLVLPERPPGTDGCLRGRARGARHARLDDRRATAVTADLPDEVAFMDGAAALPRDNGELVFAAPWEGRALAFAVALVERLDLPWDAFRHAPHRRDRGRARSPVLRELGRRARVAVVEPGLTTPSALDAGAPERAAAALNRATRR